VNQTRGVDCKELTGLSAFSGGLGSQVIGDSWLFEREELLRLVY